MEMYLLKGLKRVWHVHNCLKCCLNLKNLRWWRHCDMWPAVSSWILANKNGYWFCPFKYVRSCPVNMKHYWRNIWTRYLSTTEILCNDIYLVEIRVIFYIKIWKFSDDFHFAGMGIQESGQDNTSKSVGLASVEALEVNLKEIFINCLPIESWYPNVHIGFGFIKIGPVFLLKIASWFWEKCILKCAITIARTT